MDSSHDTTPGNPFQSPSVDPGVDILPTTDASEALRRTRPWVLFLAVLGVIGIAFMVLVTLGIGFATAMGGGGGGGGGLFLVMLLFYVAVIVGYAFPIVYMFKYCGRIRTFLAGGTADQLSRALEAQRSIWKSIGIFVLVGMVLYVLLIMAAVTGAFVIAPQQSNMPFSPPTAIPAPAQ